MIERREKSMVEVRITVRYEGLNYQTNVIAYKGMSDDEIKRLAQEQVIQQWGSRELH